MLPRADGPHTNMWVMDALHTLQSSIYPRLVGEPLLVSPPVSDHLGEALEHMTVLLHECDDLLEFMQAEHACRALHEVPHTQEVQDLENFMFNYKLAVEAVRTLQRERSSVQDPDQTIVDEPEPKSEKHTIWEEKSAELERVHAEQMASLQETHMQELARVAEEHRSSNEDLFTNHAAELAQAHKSHAKEMDDLRASYEASQAAASQSFQERWAESQVAQGQAESQHAAQIQRHERAHAVTWERTCLLRSAIEDLGSAVDYNASQLAALQQRIDAQEAYVCQLEKAHRDALNAHASLHTAHNTLSSEHSRTEKQLAELQLAMTERDTMIAQIQTRMTEAQATLQERESELAKKSSRLADVETQLVELQSEFERSTQVQTNVDQILQQLAASEAHVADLQKQLKSLELVKAERAQWAGEIHELKKLLSMYKSSASHAEQEQERVKETMEKMQVEYFVMQQALEERDAEVHALKESKRRYAEQIRTERAENAAKRDVHQQAALLEQRVADLELELSAKASEIEEADTRMLLVMKENKRLVAQMKAMRSETKHALQDVTNSQPTGASPDKRDALLPNRLARLRPVS